MSDTASALSGQAPPGPPAPLGGTIIDRSAADEIERRHRDPARPRAGEEGYAAVAEQDAELFKKAYGTAETGTTAVAARPTDTEIADREEALLGLEPLETDLKAYTPAGEPTPGRPWNQALIDKAAPIMRDLGMAPAMFHALQRDGVAHELAGPLSLEAESKLIVESVQQFRQRWGLDYERRLGAVWARLDQLARVLPEYAEHLADNRIRYSVKWMTYADDLFARRQRVDDLRALRKKHGRREGDA